MSYDLAKRVYDHTFRIDPIVRGLLDTDFYKLLMLQMIRRLAPDRRVTFEMVDRSRSVRLGEDLDEAELIAQLDHARTVRFDPRELIWLAGNTFYGTRQIFQPSFLAWLAEVRLPPYRLTRDGAAWRLRFEGCWAETTLWEIPALAIVNELRARAAMRTMSRLGLDILYAKAKSRLWDKIERLGSLSREGSLKIADFGTRRRHGFLWQRWCVEAMKDALGPNFVGTSNVKIAMDLGLEAIGTNAHELPMVYAALADTDEELRAAPYRVLADWAEMYHGNLRIVLPDTYGTTAFLAGAPDWVADWKGARPDSKPPIEAGEELIGWWRAHGQDPGEKLLILSDGMDIDTIEAAVRHFRGRVGVSIGWGTNLTNDLRDCVPGGPRRGLEAVSIVCKVVEVDGRPAVKLSDNPAKATGPAGEIARYRRVFGEAGMAARGLRV